MTSCWLEAASFLFWGYKVSTSFAAAECWLVVAPEQCRGDRLLCHILRARVGLAQVPVYKRRDGFLSYLTRVSEEDCSVSIMLLTRMVCVSITRSDVLLTRN